jgi:hypothetical protein
MCASVVIPEYDGNIKRAFLFMQSQWTKERDRPPAESLKGILTMSYKFKNAQR